MAIHIDPQPLPSNSKEVFRGRTFSVIQWEQQLYDNTVRIFEAVTRPDGAFAIGVLPNQKILLVEDEQPHRPVVISGAGGRVEPNENPEEAVRREFQEETGYTVGTLKPWFTYQGSSQVFATFSFFIARDLVFTDTKNNDEGERTTPKTYTFEDFLLLGQNPHLRDMLMRVKLLEAQIDPQKKEELYSLLYD